MKKGDWVLIAVGVACIIASVVFTALGQSGFGIPALCVVIVVLLTVWVRRSQSAPASPRQSPTMRNWMTGRAFGDPGDYDSDPDAPDPSKDPHKK